MKCVFLFLCLTALPCFAADWPMWRYDAGRTAASDEVLPEGLELQWERVESPREQVWDDPLNHDLMPYDRIFEPVVMGGKMFIGYNDRDKVVALDLETGAKVWTFYTGGPVRLPPVCWEGKVYFTSDDGHLYCVKAEDGSKVWSFSAAPSAMKTLGNMRLISAWPARGGPVIKDGKVYFAASIWPFMGTFLYALDANSGEVVWVNDGTGADFIKQPHSAAAFAGVAPQGALVATKDTLLVPGGRSVPAGFDLSTGELRYFHLNDGGKGNGGSFVAAGEKYFYVHTRERGVRVYDLKTGTAGKSTMNEPVIVGDRLYAAKVTEKDDPVVQALGTSEKVLWEVKADGSGDLIQAGGHLYAAGKKTLSAIELPKSDKDKARVAWTLPVEGNVQRLLASNGKLVAVTLDGRIQVYGQGKKTGRLVVEPMSMNMRDAEAEKLAKTLVEKVQDEGGHCLVYGLGSIGLVNALLSTTDMQITVVDPDAEQVELARKAYDESGMLGKRITFHAGDALSFQAPPYFAHGVVVSPEMSELMSRPEMLKAAYASVRPYGGILLWLGEKAPDVSGLEKARVEAVDGQQLIIREGALPGAADWTHQYGDIGNTVKSNDSRVRAPLGVLWFGGSSNMDVLPRHGHGPPEQVVGGRLYIQGMHSFSARDVYTGRVIWQHDFKDLGTFGIYYNETYEDTPLSTAYNQKHIPGANGRGTNYAATEEAVYVAVHGECHMLDSRTGELMKKIPIREEKGDPAQWAFIGVLEDLLIGGDDFAHFSLQLGGVKSRTQAPIEDYSASAGLAVYDRHSGKLLWRVKAKHSFLHNGIVAGNGRIYCLDKLTTHAEGLLKRRGRDLPKDYRIVALDARTGETLWEQEKDLFGTWLGYSAEHDLLLQAGAKASDRLSTEVGDGMIAYHGKNGAVRWQDLEREYTGPCILHNELILTGANSYSKSGGAFNLLTGEDHLVKNPLTGKMEPWRLNRTYGCNTIIASEHLLTYRSGSAGFYDLDSMSGTASLGGFKSGCTSNLVVANGVLNAPDYTRTCSCSYQNQTSLALIHMPEMEMWSYSQFGLDGEQGDRILRAGINFGAPGNRRDPAGTLWLEHPHVGDGNAPQMGVEGVDRVKWFRRHSSQVTAKGEGQTWIAASGLMGEGEIVITPSLRRPKLVKPVKSVKDKDGNEIPAPPVMPEELLKVDYPPKAHTVRLHFSEPDGLAAGGRVFSVKLQGKTVLENFDIAREAGEAGGVIVKEFPGVSMGANLKVTLAAAKGKAPPVLCGVEFVAE
ncbi:PQQ-binding-like beta-propeller repeat protein [Prosthecobacter sp. SYSU 5D2]|uniref:outer membrane protein assembly factor BamB family protein n=1 Tax=Prosthecobacter sp. SYSU 5D2 TaxID=3134134 RepID=UPI0031FE9FA9